MLSRGPFPIRRLGRRLLWAHPKLYRWFGIVRGRGDCIENGYDLWVGGYPRSANSFATAVVKLGNPSATVATHWHTPPFIINGIRRRKPGMLLIRKPVDAALSWSLFWEGRLKIEHSLNYYIDFHQALLPYREQLFVVSFDEAIGNFESVLKRFNRKFGTELEALPQNDSSLDRCFAFMEDWFREPDGRLNEFTVPRPSARRDDLKGKLAEELRTSSRLRKKLERAEQLYQSFCKPEHQLAGNDARPVAALRR